MADLLADAVVFAAELQKALQQNATRVDAYRAVAYQALQRCQHFHTCPCLASLCQDLRSCGRLSMHACRLTSFLVMTLPAAAATASAMQQNAHITARNRVLSQTEPSPV